MNDQDERLRKLYASLPDEELVRLQEQRDELTPSAQEALASEMKARGLKIEAALATDEHAGTAYEEGFTSLWGFWDPMRANEALAVLESAELNAHLVPGERRDRGDGTEATFFELLVANEDQESAIKLLRKHLGLFPLPEAVDGSYSEAGGDDDTIAIAQFENADDAAVAARALTDAGVAFRQSQDEYDGQKFWSLSVAADAMEAAGLAIEHAFPAAPEGGAEG